MSETNYEYRIVPRKFGFRDKVRLYQSKETFEHAWRISDHEKNRAERRKVEEWEEL